MIDGVVRAPSAFSITFTLSPSSTATHELVVPKSIPIIFAIWCVPLKFCCNVLLVIRYESQSVFFKHFYEKKSKNSQIPPFLSKKRLLTRIIDPPSPSQDEVNVHSGYSLSATPYQSHWPWHLDRYLPLGVSRH